MATVVITLRIMPESAENDLSLVEKQVQKKIEEFGADYGKTDIEEVAFGLKCLKMIFLLDENRGSTEELEKEIQKIEGIGSVDVIDVRRTIG